MLCVRCKKEIVQDAIYCPYCAKKQPRQSGVEVPKVHRAKGTGYVFRLNGRRARPFAAMFKGKLVGTFETEREALRALNIICKSPDLANRYTVEDMYNRFLQSQKYAKMSDSGKEGIATAWMRLSVLRKRPAIDIGTDDFQKIVDAALQVPRYKVRSPIEVAKMSPAKREQYEERISRPAPPLGYDGKNRIKQLAVHICDEMIKTKIATVNYGSKIELPRYEKVVEKRNFTEEEKNRIKLREADPVARIVLIYLACGFRLNELLGLTLDCVDLDARMMRGGSKSAAGRDRRVPIPNSVYEYIAEFYAVAAAAQNQGSECPYLLQRNGKRINDDYFRKFMFYPLLDACGIHYTEDGKNVITPHRTRHTFIADGVEAGMSPEAMKKIAGHAKYETSVNYYGNDLDSEYLREEIEKLNKP